MTLLWTTPKQWATKNPVTKEFLNDISNNLTYLYAPSVGIVTLKGTGTNQTTVSTTMVDLDAATYNVSVELSGGRDVHVSLLGMCASSVALAFAYFDVFIDNSIYLSTLTATPMATGTLFANSDVAAAYRAVYFDVVIPRGTLAAGVHTFKPRWRSSSGANTVTWYENTVLSQFKAGEY